MCHGSRIQPSVLYSLFRQEKQKQNPTTYGLFYAFHGRMSLWCCIHWWISLNGLPREYNSQIPQPSTTVCPLHFESRMFLFLKSNADCQFSFVTCLLLYTNHSSYSYNNTCCTCGGMMEFPFCSILSRGPTASTCHALLTLGLTVH